MNRSLIFSRAWREHRIKLSHGCPSLLSDCLRRYWRVARELGPLFR
jgi:hypothetical protein